VWNEVSSWLNAIIGLFVAEQRESEREREAERTNDEHFEYIYATFFFFIDFLIFLIFSF